MTDFLDDCRAAYEAGDDQALMEAMYACIRNKQKWAPWICKAAQGAFEGWLTGKNDDPLEALITKRSRDRRRTFAKQRQYLEVRRLVDHVAHLKKTGGLSYPASEDKYGVVAGFLTHRTGKEASRETIKKQCDKVKDASAGQYAHLAAEIVTFFHLYQYLTDQNLFHPAKDSMVNNS